MFFARISLIATLVCFLLIIITVQYVLVSSVLVFISYSGTFIQPVLIILLPIELMICLGALEESCNYQQNIDFYLAIFRRKIFNFVLYSSAFLLNPLLLYVYTESYNNSFRIWGAIRCFPFINLPIYIKLIRKHFDIQNEISINNLIILFFTGRLLKTIVNKNLK